MSVILYNKNKLEKQDNTKQNSKPQKDFSNRRLRKETEKHSAIISVNRQSIIVTRSFYAEGTLGICLLRNKCSELPTLSGNV